MKIAFENLYTREGLVALDARFVAYLQEADTALCMQLLAVRADAKGDYSELLIALAPHVEDFIGVLFDIEKELEILRAKHHELAPLHSCKRLFVQRRAAKTYPAEVAQGFDFSCERIEELKFATQVMEMLADEAANKEGLDHAARYAAWALYHPEGRARHKNGVLFKQTHKIDPQNLIALETELRDGVTMLKLPKEKHRYREGFTLTDPRGTLAQAMDHAHYCIYCHNQDKDSCSKGLKEKDGTLKKTLDVPLHGCPLDEKISEMNYLKGAGHPLGALAMVCVDNPLCAGTGHRICNDCMKSCIYQKQEPVNIPLVETRVLDDVLALPWGFEIYSLLTRWNPLNLAQPLPRPDTGKKVLVVGLGPAGYTLAHYLLNDGHTVVGVDGLKIEKLPEEILYTPVRDVESLKEKLDARVMAGFGGVAEYGITVRWDKNYLKLIRLLLERRAQFALFGAVRFGAQITYESAFKLGFDHVALCMGAGRPTLLDIPGGLARGVRTASDFLMALQLTGAARKDSIANLQLRLPVVVIGGGLTAIDTATEALAYYPVQVEKFLQRYEALGGSMQWSGEEAEIAQEFIEHARALRAAPKHEHFALLDTWGGVKIVYRKRLIDAPSYRLNHEEVEKAFEEGLYFAPLWEPEAVETDKYGHASAIKLKQAGGAERVSVPARSILIAAGTSPNTVLAREDAHFTLDGKYFAAVDEEGRPVAPQRSPKPAQTDVRMSAEGMSFFGDLHPSFAGNVVKAMASAKRGYPVISRVLAKKKGKKKADSRKFLEDLRGQLAATVQAVNRLTPTIVEVVVHAPLAAKHFQPGQFYRLQNFESNAPKIATTTLAMEGLAMTGAWVDRKKGLISLIILEMGGSSDICAYLKPGEEVALMGPTGTPTHIPQKKNVLLAGGGLGNAVLFSIGAAAKAQGSRVLYFAAYRKTQDRYKIKEIEAAAETVVWCCEEAAFASARKGDLTFHGNIVQAMRAYAKGELGKAPVSLQEIDHVIAIGSDRMMAAVAAARRELIGKKHAAVGSINSPMQCMMKEICGQCLQKHKNPLTGAETYVYSCFNQDQCLDDVDFSHLAERLGQNSVQEKLTAAWIDHCLKSLNLRKAAA